MLRFNPIQIVEWLQDLLDSGVAHSQVELEDRLGVGRTRIGQLMRLMKLSVDTKARLRGMPGLNEYQLRSMLAERMALVAK